MPTNIISEILEYLRFDQSMRAIQSVYVYRNGGPPLYRRDPVALLS